MDQGDLPLYRSFDLFGESYTGKFQDKYGMGIVWDCLKNPRKNGDIRKLAIKCHWAWDVVPIASDRSRSYYPSFEQF